ncbi:MAG: RHS repeat-associated core domain-containing protein, partial [Bryocella sp.]
MNTITEIVTQGTTTTTQFDGLGRKSHTTLNDPPSSGIFVDYTYDSRGNLASVSNPYRATSDPTYGVTQFTYDVLNRKRTQTQQDGNTLLWDYSGNAGTGETTKFTDEVGNQWQRTSDALGRLIQVEEPNSVPTYYSYDLLNNLTEVDQGAPAGQSGGLARSFTYDSLSRLRSATNPEAGTVSYTYYPNSDLYTKTDARGIATTYLYDELDRVKSKTYSDATYPVSYTYDISSGPSPMNTIGHLTEEKTTVQGMPMTERAIDQYDAMGRIKSERQCFVGGCGAHAYTLTHQYNLAGDVIAANNGMSNSYAESFGYSYNGAERLQEVTSSLSDATHPGTLFQAQQYGPIGLVQANYAIASGGSTAGFTQVLGRDQRERMTAETDATTAATPVTLYAYAVGYSGNGNLQSLADTQMGQWSYTYDSLNRLLQGTSSLGTYAGLTLAWGYDNYGNRLNQTASGTYGGVVPQPTPVTFNGGKNRVDTWGYDAAGDVQSDGTNMYQYDAEGRQTGTLNSMSGLTGYIYDAEGRRAMKVVVSGFGTPHATTTIQNEYLLGLEGEQVTVLDGSSNWLRTNVYANGKVMTTYDSTGTHFPLTDWLGSKRLQVGIQIVGTTATASSEEQCLSLPYGDGLDCTGADSNHLHFTGKERDTESGLDYFGARYYASSLGRFMSPDYSPTDDGPPDAIPFGSISSPQSMNGYSYVGNNPLEGTDPDGHDCVVQSRIDDNHESVSVSSGTCAGVKTGSGQSATYVPGTVTGISANGSGSIDIGYNSYDGQSSG